MKFLYFEFFFNNFTILRNFGKFWNFEIFWVYDSIRYRVCDIGYKRYRLGTIIDNAYAKHLYFNLNIWYIVLQNPNSQQCIQSQTLIWVFPSTCLLLLIYYWHFDPEHWCDMTLMIIFSRYVFAVCTRCGPLE